MATRILIASHDPICCAALAQQARAAGYTPLEAHSSAECKQIAASGSADAAVIDARSLPENAAAPLPSHAIHAADMPFRLSIFLNHIRRLINNNTSATLPLGGGWTLTPHTRTLAHGALSITLTEKECELLEALAEAAPAALERGVLLASVWGYNEGVSTHTMETHLYRLRAKLKDAGAPEDLIATTPEGYKLQP